MLIKQLSYENFNGQNNYFHFGNKLNVFTGSNGSGKTTSLDCLAILLFGESFSYRKTLEKHINVADKTKPCKLKMNVETDIKIIDENNKEIPIDVVFEIVLSIDNKGKFTKTNYINGNKVTKDKYNEKICSLFKIPYDFLDVDKMNVLRCLIDPNEITNSDNQAIYNLVKKLTSVPSLEYFSNTKEEYAIIRHNLASCGYDFKDTQTSIKSEIVTIENHIKYAEETINLNYKKLEEIRSLMNVEEYNDKVEEYNQLIDKISTLNVEKENLTLKLAESKKNDEIDKYNNINNKQKDYYELISKQKKVEANAHILNTEINACKNYISNYCFQKEALRIDMNEYEETNFEEIICDQCGKVANYKDKEAFEKNKKIELEKYREKIIEIENLIKNFDESNEKALKELKENIQPQLNEISAKVRESYTELQKAYNQEVLPSEMTKEIEQKLVENSLELKKCNDQKNEILPYLKEFNKNNDNITYIKNNNIIPAKADKEKLLEDKSTLDLKLSILNDFNIAYIKMVEKSIQDTFKDVKFNILKETKTSNRNEKMNCYAIQDDKPIFNYNTAPQIALGCKIIQLIKQKLGIKNLPILFDIIDNIGEKSLNDILKYCDSQLFCTKALFEENIKIKLISNIKEIK